MVLWRISSICIPTWCPLFLFLSGLLLSPNTTGLSKINGAKLRESFCPAADSHSRPRQAGAWQNSPFFCTTLYVVQTEPIYRYFSVSDTRLSLALLPQLKLCFHLSNERSEFWHVLSFIFPDSSWAKGVWLQLWITNVPLSVSGSEWLWERGGGARRCLWNVEERGAMRIRLVCISGLKERYYSSSLCWQAGVSLVEFQLASPAAKQDPHFQQVLWATGLFPAKQGNNTKPNKSQLHEVSGVGTLVQACL